MIGDNQYNITLMIVNKKSSTTQVLLLLSLLAICLAQNSTANCGPYCSLCSVYNPLECYQCKSSYVLDQNFQCVNCQEGCALCKSPKDCDVCSFGFTLSNNVCLPCSQFCLSCTSINDEITLTNCTSCNYGFYATQIPLDSMEASLTGKSTYQGCSACLPQCMVCKDSSSCEECAYGFGFNQTLQECTPCGDQCSACDGENGCSACQNGYYPSVLEGEEFAVCVSCAPNCSSCNENGTCQKCAIGYFPQGMNCTLCEYPCLSCLNQSICFACDGGYYLTTQIINDTDDSSSSRPVVSSTCAPCFQNCGVCKDENSCQYCLNGFYRKDNQTCESCGNACGGCDQNGCHSCVGSFYLYNGQCKSCPQLCTVCIDNSDQEIYCFECSSNQYTPIDGKCMLCSDVTEGCSSCFSSTQCLSCNVGYYLLGSECVADNGGLAVVYIVLISIAALIGLAAIIFGIWACWRSRNGYGVMGEGSNAEGVRASYYEFP